MKNLLSILLVAFLVVSSTSLTSCKYEEGPKISLKSKEKRLVNTWVFTKVVNKDGSEQNISNYDGNEIVFKEGGATDVIFQGNVIGSGTWEFNDDKTKIIVTDGNNSKDELFIVKLKSDEFWYRDDNEITYQMSPK